jgi:hypothetical protein
MKLLNFQPHRKIKYAPGMVSLILLPLLCLGWLYYNKAFERKSLIDIAFYSPEWNKSLPKDLQFEFPPKRDFTVINLKGNDKNDKLNLQYAHILLNQWKSNKDTIQGINFHFGNKAKYWTFIGAINVLKAVDMGWYMAYKNDLYATYPRGYFKQSPGSECACSLEGDIRSSPLSSNKESKRLWSERLTFIKYAVKNYWAQCLVFAVMLILTMLNLRKRIFTYDI